MQQYNGKTRQIDYYCDWCGKYLTSKGYSTDNLQFCSEKCKYEYNKVHNDTDDEVYPITVRRGFLGRLFNFTFKLIMILFIGSIILFIIYEIFSK